MEDEREVAITGYNGQSQVQENLGFIADDLRISQSSKLGSVLSPTLIAGIDPDGNTSLVATVTARNDVAGKDLGIGTYPISKNSIASPSGSNTSSATEANSVMFSVLTGVRTFITGIQWCLCSDVTADDTGLFINWNVVGGSTQNVQLCLKTTLTAVNLSGFVNLSQPVELKPGSSVKVGHVFSVGTSTRGLCFFGYTVQS